jgi:hypothetical protein
MTRLLESPAKLIMKTIVDKLKQELPDGTLVKHSIMIDENKEEGFFFEAKNSRNGMAVFVSYLGSQFDNGSMRIFDRDPQIALLAVAKDPDAEHDGYRVHDLIETCLLILFKIGLSPINDGYMPLSDKDRFAYAGMLIMEIDTTKFSTQTKVHKGFVFPDEV